MHDHVGPPEGGPQRIGVADVATAVLQLRPAAPGRVERAPRDADDPVDPVVVLEQGQQREPEGPGGPGDRHRQSTGIRHPPTLVTPARAFGRATTTSA